MVEHRSKKYFFGSRLRNFSPITPTDPARTGEPALVGRMSLSLTTIDDDHVGSEHHNYL